MVLTSVGASACDRGLPSESYEWSPPLQKTNGKLESFVSALPLGGATAIEHQHPLDPKKDGVTISNTKQLMPFITRQTRALASAAAFYEKRSGVSGAAYAALVPVNKTPSTEKKSLYSGNPDMFNPSGVSLTFHVQQVTGLLPTDDPCRLFLIRVSAVQGMGLMSYVALAGSRKNLYLELVTKGELAADNARTSYQLEAPFAAKNDWGQESLKTLARAHAETKLDVCKLPT